MSKIPLTVSGAGRLRSELQRLKTVDRPAAIAAIGDHRLIVTMLHKLEEEPEDV